MVFDHLYWVPQLKVSEDRVTNGRFGVVCIGIHQKVGKEIIGDGYFSHGLFKPGVGLAFRPGHPLPPGSHGRPPMPMDGLPELGAVYECQACAERTFHYETCPTCGCDDLERHSKLT